MPAIMNSCLETDVELEKVFSNGSGVAMVKEVGGGERELACTL